jgi:eukaryotic translation initiation factor 2C
MMFSVVMQIPTNMYTETKHYTIKELLWDPSIPGGAHAKSVKFKKFDAATKKEVEISVYDYFKKKYGAILELWNLPLIVTTRDGLFPLELCWLVPNQRYVYKCDPNQVRNPQPPPTCVVIRYL